MNERKPSARGAILQLLKQRPGVTAQELATALDVSAVAVRKHLDALDREGLVAVQIRRQRMGRPTYVYTLTSAAASLFPQAYRPMLLDVLHDLATAEGEHSVKGLLEKRSERQRLSYEAQLEGLPLSGRVRELARLRNEDGYMTSLDEEDAAFVLREYNCPIEDVSRQFRQACGCEVDLFRHLLGIERIEQIETVQNGQSCCAYRIPKG